MSETQTKYAKWLAMLTPAAGIIFLWAQVAPLADWLFDHAAIIAKFPGVPEFLISVAGALVLCGWIPYFLPDAWTRGLNKGITRGACFFIANPLYFILMEPKGQKDTIIAFLVAFICGIVAMQAYTSASALWYLKFNKPESLK